MRRRTEIGLVALGKITDKGLIEFLAFRLSQIYGQQVEISARLPFPEYAFDERRRQYYSTAILVRMRWDLGGIYGRILGIADVDLFVPSLNFVFGEADMIHGVSIISLFRLRPENYGQPAKPKLLQERSLKEATHELGHAYGLMHCAQYRCVMHFSNTLSDTDRKDHQFCRRCRDSLAIAAKNDSQ